MLLFVIPTPRSVRGFFCETRNVIRNYQLPLILTALLHVGLINVHLPISLHVSLSEQLYICTAFYE